MSASACFSNNHYAGTGSPPLELHISRSVTTTNSDSVVDSPTSAAASSNPSIDSLANLQLFVDLSSYPLQQLFNSDSSEPWSAVRQHPMVLRPQLLKTALLTAFAATSVAPNCRVMSSFAYEPLAFSDADRYEAWHGAMCNEIQVVCSNKTWSLVPFHPSMNVVGCRWVYKIKGRVDSNVKQYKAHLVARCFTQQEAIDYSETFIPVVKQTAVKLVFSIAIYMKQPLNFVNSALPFHVSWLHKSLYGLK
jgi:histone deacetylase 1/2